MPSLADVQSVLTPVIDVGGSPGAAPGDPGSQFAPTAAPTSSPPTAPDPDHNLVMAVPSSTPKPNTSLAEKIGIANEGIKGPVDEPADPAFPVQPGQKTGYVANIGAGTSEAVAGALGLPVDMATMLINAGAHVIGVHPIQDPVGGAGTFERLFGLPAKAAESLGYPGVAQAIDANPQHVAPADESEQLSRVAAQGATSAALPGGIASKLMKAGATAPALANLAATSGVGAGVGGAVGGVTGDVAAKVVPDQFKPLAQMIGGAVGAGVTGAATGTAGKIWNTAANAVRPSSQIPKIVANTISQNLDGGIPSADPAPIPSVRLNLAQSTGSPKVASSLDQLNALDTPAMQQERSAQNAQMTNAIFGRTPGEPALITGTDTTPDRIAAKGSAKATSALRQAGGIIDTEERRVWNTPALTRAGVSTETSKGLINDEIARMQREQPGLADAYEHSPLASVVRDLNAMPEQAAANELNSVRSNLLKVLRNPSVDGNVKVVARTLARLAERGLDEAPEVQGRAAYSYTPVFPQPGWARAAAQGQQTHVPAIAPDPDLVRDLAAARAFTKREAQVLGHKSFDNLMARNSYGNETATPGTALARFFDFTTGSERPGDIENVNRFLNDIRTEWLKLGAAARGTTYDPATIAPVMQQLADGTRNYLFGKFLDAITSKEFDMSGNRQLQFKNVSEWLDNNRDMLENSGLVSTDQLSLLDRFRATAALIERGSDLARTKGSPTFTRAMHPIQAIDLFTGPLIGRLAGAAAGAVMGNFLTRWFGEQAIGGLIGAEMGGVRNGQALLQAIYRVPREKLMAALGEAYRDPEIARDMAMRFSRPGPPSQATVTWLRTLLATQPGVAASEAVGTGQGAPPFPAAPAQAPPPPSDRRSENTEDPFAAAKPTLADAWQANAKLYGDWSEAQKQDGIRRGLIDPETGWPTQAGLIDAVHQYGNALLGSTSAPGGIRAFHGTPHSFEKFDLSKIGTGEGAQAYGHGLYFAENEGIARGYRDKLSQAEPDAHFIFDGRGYHQDELDDVFHNEPDAYNPISYLMGHNFDRAGARSSLVKDIEAPTSWNNLSSDEDIAGDLERWGHPNGPEDVARKRAELQAQEREGIEQAKRSLAWFDDPANAHRVEKPPPRVHNPGSMYEVNLNVNPEHMLDWDKPLSEQSPDVQQIIRDNTPASLKQYEAGGAWKSWTGERFYQAMANTKGGEAEASQALNDLGIKGVRYLDASSRNSGPRDARFIAQIDDTIQERAKKIADLQDEIDMNKTNKGVLPRFFERRQQDIAEHQDWIEKLKADRAALVRGDHLSRNNVVFDAETIAILRKYGIAGLMAGGAAAASQQGAQQSQ